MATKNILMADNKQDFLDARKPFLERKGYAVITAGNPTSAAAALEKGGIDLAILDLRLEDDDDQEDTSGLDLARKFGNKLPIIILTAFPTWEAVKTALSRDMEGLSSAVDFLSKDEGGEAMVRAVDATIDLPRFKKNMLAEFQVQSSQALHEAIQKKEAAETSDRLQKILANTEHEFLEHRKKISRRADNDRRIATAAGLAGLAIIFAAAVLYLLGQVPIAAISGLASAIVEAISALFGRRASQASKEVSDSYEELQKMYKARQLISFCDTIIDEKKCEEMKVLVIKKLMGTWLT